MIIREGECGWWWERARVPRVSRFPCPEPLAEHMQAPKADYTSNILPRGTRGTKPHIMEFFCVEADVIYQHHPPILLHCGCAMLAVVTRIAA